MLNKLKRLMNSYKREIETNNNQLRSKPQQLQETKIEKYITSCNNAINTNSIFY